MYNRTVFQQAVIKVGKAFTLLELLLVMAIISLLVQLMIPAVQAARESARRTQCQNHLRQIGLAAQMHVAANGRFPTGGWHWNWVGDPDRGNGQAQPGGWIYNLLPYLELSQIRDIGRGQSAEEKRRQAIVLQSTPAAVFNCPSRRDAQPFPNGKSHVLMNADQSELHARADYAANGGDLYVLQGLPPESYDQVDSGTYTWRDMTQATGISFMRSMIRPAHVTDGLSHTYLAGEKYLDPDHYFSGRDFGDDYSMYQGNDFDVTRYTSKTASVPYFGIHDVPNLPRRDQRGQGSSLAFGGPHPNTWNAVLCDGSVQSIAYSADGEVHRRMGNRQDGQPAASGGTPQRR